MILFQSSKSCLPHPHIQVHINHLSQVVLLRISCPAAGVVGLLDSSSPDNGVFVHMCSSSRPKRKQGRGAIFCSLITGNLLRGPPPNIVSEPKMSRIYDVPASFPSLGQISLQTHTHTGSQSGPNMADPQLALIMAPYSSHSFSCRSPSLGPPLSGAC